MAVFDRPVGASADVSELEYVSALHQTDMKGIRPDASIQAADVVNFLSSRYGIRVSHEEVRKTILRGLGGGEDDDDVIDLTEVVAILIIPELIKASRQIRYGPLRQKERNEFKSDWEYNDYIQRYEVAEARMPDPDIIKLVLNNILQDITGTTEPRPLDRELIRDIFASYGEHELVKNDEVIDEMIAAASTDADGESDERSKAAQVLDANAFARALTNDVQLYDVDSETKISTHYFDVFGTHYSTKPDADSSTLSRCLKHIPARNESAAEVGGVHRLKVNVSNDDCFWEGQHTSVNVHRDGNPEILSASIIDNALEDHEEFAEDEECPEEQQSGEVRGVERVFTYAAIDYIAATYRNKTFVVLLWVCGVATYFAYLYDFNVSYGNLNCDLGGGAQQFGCQIANGIVNWFVIMLELSIMGTTFICLSSLGNSIFHVSTIAIIIGMAAVAVFTIVPFCLEIETAFFTTKKNRDNPAKHMMYWISLLLGCMVLSMQSVNLLRSVAPRKVFNYFPKVARWFAPPIAVAESKMKQSAAFKLSKLLENAVKMHQGNVSEASSSHGKGRNMIQTSYGRALLHYQHIVTTNLEYEESVGGMVWTMKEYWSGRLYNQEGIFLSSQILAGNVAQIIICLFVLVTAINLFHEILNTEEAQDGEFLSSYAPERWMVLTTTTVGLGFGFLSTLSIAAAYLPSTISTTLQFRCGDIPTLKDPKGFQIFRFAEDTVTVLFGSIFWGAFYTAFAVAFLIGSIVFFSVWQVTASIAWGIYASLLGLTITVTLKILLLSFLRAATYAAFYRKKPAEANFMNVILESWNVALTTGFMLGRSLMLLMATTINIGRIDRPFLSSSANRVGVRNGIGLHLDYYPVSFRKAILLTEAHRHPYIERLGCLYMMKLRHGDQFARTSGSIWRLLFVFALMPWLRRYRISARPGLEDEHDEFEGARWKEGRQLPPPKKRYSVAIDSMPALEVREDEVTNDENDLSAIKSENESLKAEIDRLKKELAASKDVSDGR